MVPVITKDWKPGKKRMRMVYGFGKQLPLTQQKKIIQHIPIHMEANPHSENWPLWEVFIRARQGLDHKHAGSLYAADAQMAVENARDVYTRRSEGISIWVVESKHIHASNPSESDSLFDPANDKVYRHPSFYNLPDELKNI